MHQLEIYGQECRAAQVVVPAVKVVRVERVRGKAHQFAIDAPALAAGKDYRQEHQMAYPDTISPLS